MGSRRSAVESNAVNESLVVQVQKTGNLPCGEKKTDDDEKP